MLLSIVAFFVAVFGADRSPSGKKGKDLRKDAAWSLFHFFETATVREIGSRNRQS